MTDLPTLAGRLHPLLVHLPIGLVAGALLLGGWRRYRPTHATENAPALLWTAAAASAILAALSGLLHADDGEYAEAPLANHRLAGIALAILTALVALLHRPGPSRGWRVRARPPLVATAAAVLLYTGHGGGSLTHGPDYLTPTAATPDREALRRPASVDSMDLFADAVLPILQAKCTSCHNPAKRKGGLVLTGHAAILAGGKSGAGLTPGDPPASELFRRVSLPPDHTEFMPSDGRPPLTPAQRSILEWWIRNGAPASMPLAQTPPGPDMRALLDNYLGQDRTPSPEPPPAPASERDIETLRAAGFQVHRITSSAAWLSVRHPGGTRPDLTLLTRVRPQLLWLEVPDGRLTDTDMEVLAGLDRLVRLDLHRNPVGNDGIARLKGLRQLEYLNLYGTAVTAACLGPLTALPALQRLYVWDTGIDSLPATVSLRPGLTVVWQPQ